MRSEPWVEPTLICCAFQPVAKSASQLSSVSPERAETTVLKPAPWALSRTLRVSETSPFWFGLMRMAFALFSAIPRSSRDWLVVNKSSPSNCKCGGATDAKFSHESQSSSAKGSSMEMMGWFFTRLVMKSTNSADVWLCFALWSWYWPFSKNCVDAISSARETSTPGLSPISSIHETTKEHASSIESNGIPRPPSSATRWVTKPFSRPRTAASSRIATIHESASEKDVAPCGSTSTSWISSVRLAWAPPERIFTIGIGSKRLPVGVKKRASDWFLLCASASAPARETARVAFAPNPLRLTLESISLIFSSTVWSATSLPTSAGAIFVFIFATAVNTDLPP